MIDPRAYCRTGHRVWKRAELIGHDRENVRWWKHHFGCGRNFRDPRNLDERPQPRHAHAQVRIESRELKRDLRHEHPHAMLADVTSENNSSSCPAPSPISAFRSTLQLSFQVQFEANAEAREISFRVAQTNSCASAKRHFVKTNLITRPKLSGNWQIHGDHVRDSRSSHRSFGNH